MRIIGGKYKSRRIKAPANLNLRPTTDFAKESLFNILENKVEWETTHALDLFSGTGSIALELVSRGCPRVVSVEMNVKNYRFICKAKEILAADELMAIKGDVFKFLKNRNEAFNFVFADPPYSLPRLETLPQLVIDNGWVADNGLFVFEHSKNFSFSYLPHFQEERRYGSVHFSIFTF